MLHVPCMGSVGSMREEKFVNLVMDVYQFTNLLLMSCTRLGGVTGELEK